MRALEVAIRALQERELDSCLVGAVDAQGADARATRAVGAVPQPVLWLPGQEKVSRRQIGAYIAQAADRRKDLLVEAERRLDRRGESRGGAGMADVGLDAAEMAYGRHVAGGKEGAASVSMRSSMWFPLPCVSTYPTRDGSRSASSYARVSARP